jgi:hypothetical protein
MIGTTHPLTNVYYLAPPAIILEPAPPMSRVRKARLLWLRLLTTWWRVRLTAREVQSALRRFGRAPIEIDVPFLEQRAEFVVAPPRPSVGPARILDFAAARQRLRH